MYYKTKINELFYDPSTEVIVDYELVKISNSEYNEILSILSTPTESQVLAQRVKDYKQYLKNTDWYYARKLETYEDVPVEVVSKRLEARDFIRANDSI